MAIEYGIFGSQISTNQKQESADFASESVVKNLRPFPEKNVLNYFLIFLDTSLQIAVICEGSWQACCPPAHLPTIMFYP